MLIKICKQYSHLLEFGKKYTGTQFAAIVQEATKRAIKTLKNSPLMFERSVNGIIIDIS